MNLSLNTCKFELSNFSLTDQLQKILNNGTIFFLLKIAIPLYYNILEIFFSYCSLNGNMMGKPQYMQAATEHKIPLGLYNVLLIIYFFIHTLTEIKYTLSILRLYFKCTSLMLQILKFTLSILL